MFARFLFAFLGLCLTLKLQGQTLTISSAANSSSNWSLSGGVLTVSGTVNIQAAQIQTWLNQGDLNIVGSTTTFVVNVNQDITSSTSGSDLTIGAANNVGAIVISSDITIAGGLVVRGGDVQINANITSTATGDLFFQGLSDEWSIRLASAKTIEKTAGTGLLTFQGNGRINNHVSVGSILASGAAQLDVVMIAEMDDGTAGLYNLSTGNITTNGGKIWMGAGPKTRVWNGLGVGSTGVPGNTTRNGIEITGNISTNGGDILLWSFLGSGARSNGYGDIVAEGANRTINAGTGDIILMTRYNDFVDDLTILSVNTTGALILTPASNANFDVAIDCSGTLSSGTFAGSAGLAGLSIANFSSLGELMVGSYNGTGVSGDTPFVFANVADFNLNSALNLSAKVSFYGGDINLNQNINTTAGATLGAVLCKASGNIILAASRSITTSGGDVILWANSDNQNSAGSVALRNTSSIVTGSNSVAGGHVWIGGGSNGGTWNSLAVGAGYAVPGDNFTPPIGSALSTGVYLEGNSISTFGGDLKILGNAPSGGRAITTYGSISIDSKAGTIEIEANATNSAIANAYGILFGIHDISTASIITLASSAAGDAITVSGFARGTDEAIGLSGTLTALSTGTGNIVFNGTSYGTGTAIKIGNYYHGKLNAYAASGSITFNGGVKGLQVSVAQVNGITTGPSKLNIGQGGGINSSSSPVILTGDILSIAADGIAVNSSGPLTIQPSSNSFTNALTFPITNLTVSNTITGLTLGKSSNSAGITIGAVTSINGPIEISGGALTLNAALSTTNITTGNMSLKGTTLSGGSLSVANGRTLTFNLSSNTTYAGTITGSGLNVVKEGAGILALTASNTSSFATLTISGGTYRLNSNQQLTLSGALTNNGAFVMRDGATFKLATSGSSIAGSGTFTVQKYLGGNNSTWNTANSGRFWYMGVPMNNVARSSFGNHNETSNRLFSYSETTKQYTNLTNNAALLSRGTGYVHRRSSNDTLSFSAAGVNGLYGEDLTLSGLTRTSGASVGFHLISNPYMAYLDWHAVTKTNVESTYYIRSNNAGNDISALITYNGSNQQLTNNSSLTLTAAQMQYIAPMQAIWVRVGPNTGTGSLAMTRSMLSHQTGNPGLKSSTIFPTLARVNLVDGPRFDQLLVFMNQDMSNAVDEYDSEKMFVSGNPQIYTMAAGKKLVMNGLNSNKKKISVPLYLDLPESKVYNLQLTEYILEDGIILLEDKQEGTIQDFTIHDTYAFYANSGVLSNRFVLHFFMPDATITAQGPSNSWVEDETSYTEGGSVQITADSKGKVQISLDQPETDKVEGTVQATDANGRVVYSGALEGLTTEFQLNVPSGIYYLTVQSGNMTENKKVFIQD